MWTKLFSWSRCDDKEITKNNKSGSTCRSCGEFNTYAEPDKITEDRKHTCYQCVIHPDRRKKGIPADKIDEFLEYYKDILDKFYRKINTY